MSAESFRMYVCPQCKGQLVVAEAALTCTACQRAYPIVEGIPDFLLEWPEESENRILRNIERVDKLARFYETKLWYPFVLNVYGGYHVKTFDELVTFTREKMAPVKGLVLDVACGPGTYGRRAAGPEREVYGIDLSLGMLRQGLNYLAEENITAMHFSRADVESLPFGDHLFDGVLCCGSLHLFPDTVKALREIGRTMKSGAPLVVFTFTWGDKGLLKYRWARERLRRRGGLHVFELPEIEGYLKQTGFWNFQPEVCGSILIFSAQKHNL